MKNRNPFAVFFYSIITFGIYDLYWLVQTKKVLNEKTQHRTPTIWALVVPLVAVFVGYIMLFASGTFTTTANMSGSSAYANNSTTTPIAHPAILVAAVILLVIGGLASFIISAYWYFKFSKAINEYTQGKMSTGVSFLVLWLIHLIGVALIQDTFNEMGEAGVNNAQPTFAPTGAVPAPPVPVPTPPSAPQPSVAAPDITPPPAATPSPAPNQEPEPAEAPEPPKTPEETPSAPTPPPADQSGPDDNSPISS